MLIIISAVLVGLSLLAFIVLGVLQRMEWKWQKLPYFVYNYVGGRLAICSIAEYSQVKMRNPESLGIVTVPDTLVLTHSRRREKAFPGLTSGQFVWAEGGEDGSTFGYVIGGRPTPTFQPWMKTEDLFVPFASERLLPIEAQREFFSPPQDPWKFEDRHRQLQIVGDRRLRFVEWAKKANLAGYRVLALLLFFSSWVYCMYFIESYVKEAAGQETVMLYTTDAKGAHGVKIATNETGKLLMDYHLIEQTKLVRGKISRVQLLGGSSAIACVTRPNDAVSCGFASPSLKTGDEAFLRFGRVTMRIDSGARSVGHKEFANWFITRAEAGALVATGQFTIID